MVCSQAVRGLSTKSPRQKHPDARQPPQPDTSHEFCLATHSMNIAALAMITPSRLPSKSIHPYPKPRTALLSASFAWYCPERATALPPFTQHCYRASSPNCRRDLKTIHTQLPTRMLPRPVPDRPGHGAILNAQLVARSNPDNYRDSISSLPLLRLAPSFPKALLASSQGAGSRLSRLMYT